MQKAGNLWVPDSDWYFGPYFAQYGDVFEEVNLIVGLSKVRQFRTAVDGGAHVGSWARALAGKFARVVAYEPQPENFECALANLTHLCNVELRNAALGAEPGNCALASGSNSGCWHVADGGGVTVETLDSRGLSDVDYLKLDVEGYEWFALKGALETIRASHPVVQIEEKWLPHSYDGPTARSLLEAEGYTEAAKAGRDVIFTWG